MNWGNKEMNNKKRLMKKNNCSINWVSWFGW
jgi:hypothetical protein